MEISKALISDHVYTTVLSTITPCTSLWATLHTVPSYHFVRYSDSSYKRFIIFITQIRAFFDLFTLFIITLYAWRGLPTPKSEQVKQLFETDEIS